MSCSSISPGKHPRSDFGSCLASLVVVARLRLPCRPAQSMHKVDRRLRVEIKLGLIQELPDNRKALVFNLHRALVLNHVFEFPHEI